MDDKNNVKDETLKNVNGGFSEYTVYNFNVGDKFFHEESGHYYYVAAEKSSPANVFVFVFCIVYIPESNSYAYSNTPVDFFLQECIFLYSNLAEYEEIKKLAEY